MGQTGPLREWRSTAAPRERPERDLSWLEIVLVTWLFSAVCANGTADLMATSKTFSRLGALILALALAPAPAWPQGSPSGPVEPTPPPPVGAPQPTAPPADGRPSLVPNAGDPVDVDEVTLP